MSINVGDLVRITKEGCNYSGYRDMFIQLGFSSHEPRDNPYSNGNILRVFATAPHPASVRGTILYGLEPLGIGGDTQVLMDNNGIEQVLPNKWALKLTEDNVNECSEWRGMDARGHSVYNYMLCDIPTDMLYAHSLRYNRGFIVSGRPEGYTEITTEQFRQYVLNQTTTDMPAQELPTNLENEQEDSVVTTTDRVICMTDKWNYINLGEVYEVIKRDEYYTYVKDSIGGESRYAHHYFEEWVDAETKAKRDSFKALFGEHSRSMFNNASDEVQKLMSELYPKLYEYRGWIKLKKDNNHESAWLFDGLDIRLIQDEDTPNEKLRGTIRFDQSDYILDTFQYQGHTFIRFKRNR